MTSYHAGDHVHVAMFGKGVVREVRNHGRYLVDVKGRAMEVAESQLSPRDAKSASRLAAGSLAHGHKTSDRVEPSLDSARERSDAPAARASDGGVVSLDLHGHTVEEALEALERCLSDALLAGASEVHVIHGKSGGRIKDAVHRRLGEIPSLCHFRLDSRNEGVTIVTL